MVLASEYLCTVRTSALLPSLEVKMVLELQKTKNLTTSFAVEVVFQKINHHPRFCNPIWCDNAHLVVL